MTTFDRRAANAPTFLLYVTGMPPANQAMLRRLRRLLDAEYGDGYDLQVCDVFEHPHKAHADGIFATPTLLRRHPTPQVRIIGTRWSEEGLPVALRQRAG
jgi:circadian clock protein KaiB